MLVFFIKELLVKGRCQSLHGQNEQKQNNVSGNNQFTIQNLHARGGREYNRYLYCQGNHSSTKCCVVTNIEASVAILRKLARCIACLRSGQISKNCSSNFVCNNCRKCHHTSICQKDSDQNKYKNTKNQETKETNATHT